MAGKRTPNSGGHLREYDFSSWLALYGSWSLTRDEMLKVLEETGHDMWTPILWPRTEDETEESIRQRLTGMSYKESVHRNFRAGLHRACRTPLLGLKR